MDPLFRIFLTSTRRIAIGIISRAESRSVVSSSCSCKNYHSGNALVIGEKSLQKLPVGLNDFEKIITGGYVYVDKTKYISELISSRYPFHFLARPRGFGKSLLISTIEALFRNKKALFKGTEIYERYRKWTEHPVVKIDLSTFSCTSPEEFENSLRNALKDVAKSYGLPELQGDTIENYITNLMEGLRREFSERIVVLINKSDHPFTDNLNYYEKANPFAQIMNHFQVNLRQFEDNIEFGLITGVHTIAWRATKIGFTKEEVEQYFGDHLEAIALSRNVNKEEVYRDMCSRYGPYNFSGRRCQEVFNPYSVLRYLQSKKLQDFWTESHSPFFSNTLQNLIRCYPFEAFMYLRNREDIYCRLSSERISDNDDVNLQRFMFQSGYLNIITKFYYYDDFDDTPVDLVNLANQEVREAFHKNVEQSLNLDVHEFFKIIDDMEKAIKELCVKNFIFKLKEYMSMTANFTFPEYMYNEECRISNKEHTIAWDWERKKEWFWLNFHTALRLAGITSKRSRDESQEYPSDCAIIRKIDGGSCYIFLLSTRKIDPFEECIKLDNNGDLDDFYDRKVKIPVVCVGLTFDASSGKIMDWKATKFSRVTTHTEERIE